MARVLTTGPGTATPVGETEQHREHTQPLNRNVPAERIGAGLVHEKEGGAATSINAAIDARLMAEARQPDFTFVEMLQGMAHFLEGSDAGRQDQVPKLLRDLCGAVAEGDLKRAIRCLAQIAARPEVPIELRAQVKLLKRQLESEGDVHLAAIGLPFLMLVGVTPESEQAAAEMVRKLGCPLQQLDLLIERGFFGAATAIVDRWRLPSIDPGPISRALPALIAGRPDFHRAEAMAELAKLAGVADQAYAIAKEYNAAYVAAAVVSKNPGLAFDREWLQSSVAGYAGMAQEDTACYVASALGWPDDSILTIVKSGLLERAWKIRPEIITQDVALRGITSALKSGVRKMHESVLAFAEEHDLVKSAFSMAQAHGALFAIQALKSSHPELELDPAMLQQGVRWMGQHVGLGSNDGFLYRENHLVEMASLVPGRAMTDILIEWGCAGAVMDLQSRGQLELPPQLACRAGFARALKMGAHEDSELVAYAGVLGIAPQEAYDRLISSGRIAAAESIFSANPELKTAPEFVLQSLPLMLTHLGTHYSEEQIMRVLDRVEPTQVLVDVAAEYGRLSIVKNLIARAPHLKPSATSASAGAAIMMCSPRSRPSEDDVIRWSEWAGHPHHLRDLVMLAGFDRAGDRMRAANPFPGAQETLSALAHHPVQLIDAGVRGRIDPEDLVREAGKVTKLGMERFLDLRLRSCIVRAGEEMAVAGCSFAGAHGVDRVNTELWTLGKGGRMQVRKHASDGLGSPAKAFRDLFRPLDAPQSKYAFECAASNQLILVKGILNFLEELYGKDGDKVFDKLMTAKKYPVVWRWDEKPELLQHVLVYEPNQSALIPGSQYHYTNPDTPPPWAGENVIYLGREPSTGLQLFYAHGIFSSYRGHGQPPRALGIISEQELIEALTSLQSPGASTPPHRLTFRNSIDVAKLMQRAEKAAAELGIQRTDEASLDLDQPRANSYLLRPMMPAVSFR